MSPFDFSGPKSPCTDDCVFDHEIGRCMGCQRTLDEVIDWSSFDDAKKIQILVRLGLKPDGGPG